jgi:hypothetical protein
VAASCATRQEMAVNKGMYQGCANLLRSSNCAPNGVFSSVWARLTFAVESAEATLTLPISNIDITKSRSATPKHHDPHFYRYCSQVIGDGDDHGSRT